MLDKETTQIYKESGLLALALNTPKELLEIHMKEMAQDEENPQGLEIAEGLRLALELYNNAGSFNCRIKIDHINLLNQ